MARFIIVLIVLLAADTKGKREDESIRFYIY